MAFLFSSLNAEPVCRLCQLIINEINSRVRPGARKTSWSRGPPGNLPVSRRASPPLTYVLRSADLSDLRQLFRAWIIWYVISRCDLDLWPLDLELLQHFG